MAPQQVPASLRIAIIGQSQFAAEVYSLLRKNGHIIVGVFTIPDKDGRVDPLAEIASRDGVSVFKFSRWRLKGVVLPEVLEQYKSVGAELNVLPFCSQFIPMEVINCPTHESIIYHPSILPRHRGASAINWTLMQGDKEAGFSIFWADDGLDTGPILLQRSTVIKINDTVESLYNRFLFPVGITAMAEAVELIAAGTAPRITQPEEGATYDAMIKKALTKVDWSKSAKEIHNFIRGNDKVPGAWTLFAGDQKVTLYGSRLWTAPIPRGTEVEVEAMSRSAVVHKNGMLMFGADGKAVNISQLQFENGHMIHAAQYGKEQEEVTVELTEDEQQIEQAIRAIWSSILNREVTDQMDFFKMGARSMEVVRLVEEVRQKCSGIQLMNEDVYMATILKDFVKLVILKGRGDSEEKFTYDAVTMDVNGMKISFPHQLFIDNEFVDSSDGRTFTTINPTDESVICEVAMGTAADVDAAVHAAQTAFTEGEWGKMNARDRANLMYRLADLMCEHQEELATLEAIDSGAVYTLALKTHVGMSIATFRYFAGWCDKIQGKVIPINNARPSRNMTYTKCEPIGVCAIITPWNYPLMMLAWKMAPCLAAGNTVLLKPAQVTPLTSLKFCELVVKAGFPPGVVNVIPGSGRVVGEAFTNHSHIRKLGFTGSTPVGKTIMQKCAKSNLKKVTLELGGKSPLIIFSDCDLDKAVRSGASAVFFNKGENCIAAGRLFVAEKIHEEFLNRLLKVVKQMKIGDPLDRSVDHGPQNHKAHFQSLLEYISTGLKEGATLVHGGTRVDRPGLFLHPTIFTDVQDDMFIAKEESFGPIMVISKFNEDDIDDVLRRANDVEYGLAAGVFTSDLSRALYVADNIDAGTVFINTYNKTDVAAPFGGFKQSGFGKDLGEEALYGYLKTKAVTIEY